MLEAVRRSMRQIRAALSAAEIDPVAPTCADLRQFEGVSRVHGEIQALAKKGVPIEQAAPELVAASDLSDRCQGHGAARARGFVGILGHRGRIEPPQSFANDIAADCAA